MIKLTFSEEYKSIKAFDSIDLPDLTILTGLNGSGKTHLLEAIAAKKVRLFDRLPDTYSAAYYDWNSFVPNSSGRIDPNALSTEHDAAWNVIKSEIKSARKRTETVAIKLFEQYNLAPRERTLEYFSDLSEEDVTRLVKENGNKRSDANHVYGLLRQKLKDNDTLSYGFGHAEYSRETRQLISNYLRGNSLYTRRTEDEFKAALIDRPTDNNIFQQSFTERFLVYFLRREDNEWKIFKNERRGGELSTLTDEEFEDIYGEPPWDIVNRTFKRAGLDFRIDPPDQATLYQTVDYRATLTKVSSDVEVDFSTLSSGEKILMALTLCLYNSENLGQSFLHPEILLLDEIDAPLHPSLTKAMLETIEEELVEKRGIKVILSTHSPSTVALAEEEQIYLMDPSGSVRLRKATKDMAIDTLTEGIPTLSIDYENRRQIFVESEIDAKLYNLLADVLGKHLESQYSVNFISTGGKGKSGSSENEGCERVKKILGNLLEGGARNIYGLVDWDANPEDISNGKLKVLAEGRRYSIENCILDPLLIAIFLLRDSHVEANTLKLPNGATHMDFKTFTNDQLQLAANYVVGRIQEVANSEDNPDLENKLDEVSCTYLCGKEIKVPRWYLEQRGHNLEETVKKAFPALKAHNNSGKLLTEMIRRVIREHHTFVPNELVNVLRALQK